MDKQVKYHQKLMDKQVRKNPASTTPSGSLVVQMQTKLTYTRTIQLYETNVDSWEPLLYSVSYST